MGLPRRGSRPEPTASVSVCVCGPSGQDALFLHSVLRPRTNELVRMSRGVAKEDAHDMPPLTREASQSIATPKKKDRNSKSAATTPPSSLASKPRTPKVSRDSDDPLNARSIGAPLSAPKKSTKSKKPTTTILGHQFHLGDESQAHSAVSDPSLLEYGRNLRRALTWDEDTEVDDDEPRRLPTKHETSDGIFHHLGSSAPELHGPHSLPDRMALISSGAVIESEADRMMIEQLKTKRDLYLRTVSLTQPVSETLREDLDILQSNESTSSSSDEDEDDEEDGRIDPRLRRASSVEEIFFVPSACSAEAGGSSNSSGSSSFDGKAFLGSSSMKSPHVAAVAKRAKRAESQENFSSGEFETKHFGPDHKKKGSKYGPTLATLRSSDRILKEGIINKKGRRGGWQRRYLALDKRRLYLYKSKTANKAPKQIILLSFAQCKASPDTSKQPRFWIFDVFTPEKKFVLGTAHQTELESWISAIQAACEGSMMSTLDSTPPTLAQLRRSQSNAANLLSQSTGGYFGGGAGHTKESSGGGLVTSAPLNNSSSATTGPHPSSAGTHHHHRHLHSHALSASSPSLPGHSNHPTSPLASPTTSPSNSALALASPHARNGSPPSSPERANTPTTGTTSAAAAAHARSPGSIGGRSYATKDILSIREMPGNNVCCDCSATSPEWAVINLGSFICIDCSGIHRSLGVQISKVRSLTLDRWEQQHIQKMRDFGNASINQLYEHSVPPYRTKPSADASLDERRYWIQSKYVKRSFFDPSKLHEHPAVPQTVPSSYNEDLDALKPALLELLQTDKEFRKHVRSLLLED